MRTTAHIARKELLELVRDGRFRLLAVLTLLVSVAALAAGWKQYTDVERQHTQAQQATRAQWLQQPAKNPHSAAHYGMYAFKPRTRLSLVDTGVDPYVGVAAWLEAHKQNEFRYRPAQDRTAVQRFGELTAAEACLVVVPLFIVLIAFGALAGEREQGTLRQVLSLGVSRGQLFLGKALGTVAALGLVAVPSAALGAAALLNASIGDDAPADLTRATLIAGTYLAYFAVWIAVSLGVSARAPSPRTALVVLLALWFANGLVATRAAGDFAAWLYPVPSTVTFQTELEQALANQDEMRARLERRRQDALRAYNVTSVDALPISFTGISLQEGEEHGNEVFDRHYGRLFTRYEAQNRAVQWTGFIAPMLAVRPLSMALAGTDFAHHRAFVAAAEAHRRGMQRVLNADIVAHAKPGAAYVAGPELWARVPAFDYRFPPAWWAVRQALPSALLLAVWGLASGWFALTAMRRQTAD